MDTDQIFSDNSMSEYDSDYDEPRDEDECSFLDACALYLIDDDFSPSLSSDESSSESEPEYWDHLQEDHEDHWDYE